MSVFNEIFAQSREVLMQNRQVDATITNLSGTTASIKLIPGAVSKMVLEPAVSRELSEVFHVEIPTSTAEEGIETIDRGFIVTINGVAWGVHQLLPGSPGLHHVQLTRESRVHVGGRRLASPGGNR